MRFDVRRPIVGLVAAVAMAACGSSDDGMGPDMPMPLDPSTAPRVTIDRFSDAAAMLFRRSANSSMPATGAAIDFDQAPFITQGLGPDGAPVRYYNFDVMSTQPAPIFVLFREGSSSPVSGQLNIIDVIPGDEGYNDFWQVNKVTVPADYVANTVTNLQDIVDGGYTVETMDAIVNCPVVPEGSTATEGPGASGLTLGWYRDQVVFYFDFNEASITAVGGAVPSSDIFVAFNVNPDQTGGGPASGFMTQGSSVQTHNVVESVPGDADYSPLWDVMPYDNADFNVVWDLPSAMAVNNFGLAAQVNCPIVFTGQPPGNAETASEVEIDRFSDIAGHLFMRSVNAALPGAGEAIDFDQEPFISQGLGPSGEVVQYYNFDVQPTAPAPIFALFYESGDPVPGQHNIVDDIPGDSDYNDFWQVVKVTVPDGYIANMATSLQDLVDGGYSMDFTDILVNCPIVPDGSTAALRYNTSEDPGLTTGWYQGEVVYYFNFFEAPLNTTMDGAVPTSDIYVSFNINPDQPDGGPPSGFMTETGTNQTHNVVETIPGDTGYSPLWDVMPYDNASFDSVSDLASAMMAPNFGLAATVNCPIVSVQ